MGRYDTEMAIAGVGVAVVVLLLPFLLVVRLAQKKVDILVATHAVLTSASTAFRDLGLAVVDEEQRFGVEQRDRLTGA